MATETAPAAKASTESTAAITSAAPSQSEFMSGLSESLTAHFKGGESPPAEKVIEKSKEEATRTEEVKADPTKTVEEDPLAGLETLKVGEKKPEAKEGEKKSEEITDTTPAGKVIAEFKKEKAELAKSLAARDEEIVKLKEAAMDPDARKRLEVLESMHAVRALPEREDYKKEVILPQGEQESIRDAVAEVISVSSAELQTILEIKNPLQRNIAIRKAVTATKLDDEKDVASAISTLEAVGAAMADIEKKHLGYVSNARELEKKSRSEHAMETSKQQQERLAKEAKEFSEASTWVESQLTERMPALFTHPELGKEVSEAVKAAKPSDTPNGRAYQAQAAKILPFMTKLLIEKLGKLSEYEAKEAAINGATPKIDADTSRATPEKADLFKDLPGLLKNAQA